MASHRRSKTNVRTVITLTTTGAATKLGSSGITDAKLHNIPAVYVIALNSTLSIGLSPLQDVSEHGMNVIPQLRAELGEACIVVDDISKQRGPEFADLVKRIQDTH